MKLLMEKRGNFLKTGLVNNTVNNMLLFHNAHRWWSVHVAINVILHDNENNECEGRED